MDKDKKPEAKSEDKDLVVEIVSILFVVWILMSLLTGVFNFLSSLSSGDSSDPTSGYKRFTPRGIMLSHTRPMSSVLNPIGARVASVNKTDVYDSPGGRKIGEQKINARGTVTQGPVEIGGVRYYYVDYDSGEDGWVRESDIGYLESEPNFAEKVLLWFFGSFWWIKLILYLFSLVCIGFIIYLFRKIDAIATSQRKLIYPAQQVVEDVSNERWEKILKHTDSSNENDWRLAIIEADIMLDELLDNMSIDGETIGDKLKRVEKSDFTTLDKAWEAHKIRNEVAHQGSGFLLNQREAKRVIGLYEAVFEEFGMV